MQTVRNVKRLRGGEKNHPDSHRDDSFRDDSYQ